MRRKAGAGARESGAEVGEGAARGAGARGGVPVGGGQQALGLGQCLPGLGPLPSSSRDPARGGEDLAQAHGVRRSAAEEGQGLGREPTRLLEPVGPARLEQVEGDLAFGLAQADRRDGGLEGLQPVRDVLEGAGFLRPGGAGKDHVGAVGEAVAQRVDGDDEATFD